MPIVAPGTRFVRTRRASASKPSVHALFLTGCLLFSMQMQAGTWAPLAHAPPVGLNNALLMSDGTVICGDGGSGWYRLTPDNHSSYVNGTWTPIASTHYTRLFYSSDVLTNGNVYVAGGEYGTGKDRAELYSYLTDTWAEVPRPASAPVFSDAVSKILPNGNVLQGTTGTGVWIYNVAINTITATASARNQNEACWVKLPNDGVLTIDAFGMQSEHYAPSTSTWVSDNNVPVTLYGYGGEMGAGFVLPNGKVFYLGGSTHTAIYTPGATASVAGSWVAGPEMIFGGTGFGAVDAPAAMMVNGIILCALGTTNGFGSSTSFYEYDYQTNGFTQVNGPTGVTLGTAPFTTSMLDLPDGNVLYIAGQGSTSVYVYTPGGSPLAQGQPVINNIMQNSDGSYHLVGLGLNGISGGAAYGDDWQMDSNYPLVRMTNTTSGNVYYARTFGWNSTGVMTSNKIITTEFSLPPNLPAGNYSLIAVANGNASTPTNFTYSPGAVPTGFSGVAGNNQVRLSWNPVAGATSYNIKRSTRSGGYYVSLATVAGTNYTDSAVTNGITYYYVLTAVGSGGPSTNTPQLALAPFGPPPTPTGLTAGPDSYLGVSLFWNPAPGATNYNVKRSNSTGGPYTNVTTRPNVDYNDTNVIAGTTYYYVVSALSAGGESGNSAQVFATPFGIGDVTNGLVANWRFDDGSGTTAADSSLNNNIGTLQNSSTWVNPGRIGPWALSFDTNTLDSVNVNNAATLNMTAGITIAAWVNPIDWAGNRRILQKGNSDNQYRLLAENNVLKFDLKNVGNITGELPATNAWTHVAGTWNGSTMTLYTNGVVRSSSAASGSLATTADLLAIARKNTGTAVGDFFYGMLDEVRIYNRGLGLAEVNTIMHAGDSVPIAPTGLSAVASNAQVTLAWTASSAASSYNVKRSTFNGGPYTIIGTAFGPSYTDGGLNNGTTYYYVVSAVNFINESANSSQVSSKPGLGVAFFVSANYTGAASQVLPAGNYTLSQLSANGVANDSSSSCKIPPGWTVVIYQNDNFLGTSWTLTADTPLFSAYSGLNDNMSSCKIMAPATPGIPTGLGATPGNAQVSLAWNTSASANYYNVKRSTNSGGPFATVATAGSPALTDTGLANGTLYYYVVSSAGTNTESANSVQASARPLAPPAVPTGLTALAGDTQVNLTWDTSSGATGYKLKRSLTSGGAYVVVTNTAGTNFLDSSLVDGTTYYYVVAATNSASASADSGEVSATPLPPPPVTIIPGPFTNGQFTIQFNGTDGYTYIVDTSSNLFDWAPLYTNSQSGGVFIFTDTNGVDPARFYRVRQ